MPRPEIFLSHASADKESVKVIARQLQQHGISTWLDEWDLVPGDPWVDNLGKALRDCSGCIVFVGPGGTGPWHHEEVRRALDLAARDTSYRLVPVLLPGAQPKHMSKLPSFLASRHWVRFRERLDERDAIHRLVCGLRGVEPGLPMAPPGRTPFPLRRLVALGVVIAAGWGVVSLRPKPETLQATRPAPAPGIQPVSPSTAARVPKPSAPTVVLPPAAPPAPKPVTRSLEFATPAERRAAVGALTMAGPQVERVRDMPPGTYAFVHARQLQNLRETWLERAPSAFTYEVQRGADGELAVLGFVSERENVALGDGRAFPIDARPAPDSHRHVLVALSFTRITGVLPLGDLAGPYLRLFLGRTTTGSQP